MGIAGLLAAPSTFPWEEFCSRTLSRSSASLVQAVCLHSSLVSSGTSPNGGQRVWWLSVWGVMKRNPYWLTPATPPATYGRLTKSLLGLRILFALVFFTGEEIGHSNFQAWEFFLLSASTLGSVPLMLPLGQHAPSTDPPGDQKLPAT